ncbi:Double-stranded RNA-binding [Artemisia annua]|uniref:Double-stranded RNA-binding n=1 Tax=Artemisia annua TaxID=35608 RepID=A0A2U1QJG1_ARTAN|nr:Double-stranded RNA-binding [Artemisia annua]
MQAALVKDPGVSVNRLIWSPDGSLFEPAYQTAQLNTPPVFSSSLIFGDVSCTEENSRSKKEAEQSAARAAALVKDPGVSVNRLICSPDGSLFEPAYQTAQLNTPPVFSSSLIFGDVSCTEENSKSKKEAEQSAARAG